MDCCSTSHKEHCPNQFIRQLQEQAGNEGAETETFFCLLFCWEEGKVEGGEREIRKSCHLTAVALHLLKRKCMEFVAKGCLCPYSSYSTEGLTVAIFVFPQENKREQVSSQLLALTGKAQERWEHRGEAQWFPRVILPQPCTQLCGSWGNWTLPALAGFVAGPAKTPQSIRS